MLGSKGFFPLRTMKETLLPMNDCFWTAELMNTQYQLCRAFLEHDARGKHILENLICIHCGNVMNQIIHMYFADSVLDTRNNIVSSFFLRAPLCHCISLKFFMLLTSHANEDSSCYQTRTEISSKETPPLGSWAGRIMQSSD